MDLMDSICRAQALAHRYLKAVRMRILLVVCCQQLSHRLCDPNACSLKQPRMGKRS